jgi:Mor family transcriptional regulator
MSELIADMRKIMTSNAISDDIAGKVIDELAVLWQGINVYFPKRRAENNEKIRADICHDYQDGIPVNQLVIKYGITQAWIYKIISEQKAKI